jgi:hypothetical protein
MKTLSKLILLIITVALVALPKTASAQSDTKSVSGLTGGTNNVAGSATNIYSSTAISVPRSANVGIYVEFKLQSSGTGNVDFLLTPTDGAGNASTVVGDIQTVRVAGNGTTKVIHIANVSSDGIPGWQLTVANTNTVAVTNIVVKAITKNGL